MSDHISLAREYIAKGEEFYAKAADEIIAAFDEGAGYAAIARGLSRSETWVRDLAAWRRTGLESPNPQDPGPSTPYAGQYEERMDRAARTALKDPEQRKQVISSLSAEQIEDVIAEAQTVAVERVHAQRAEHDTTPKTPTAGDLMGGERWDPSESWSDTLLIRCNRNLRELSAHVQRWGFVLGSMPVEDAYEYIAETERLAADIRAAVQEQIRDRAGV